MDIEARNLQNTAGPTSDRARRSPNIRFQRDGALESMEQQGAEREGEAGEVGHANANPPKSADITCAWNETRGRRRIFGAKLEALLTEL